MHTAKNITESRCTEWTNYWYYWYHLISVLDLVDHNVLDGLESCVGPSGTVLNWFVICSVFSKKKEKKNHTRQKGTWLLSLWPDHYYSQLKLARAKRDNIESEMTMWRRYGKKDNSSIASFICVLPVGTCCALLFLFFNYFFPTKWEIVNNKCKCNKLLILLWQ